MAEDIVGSLFGLTPDQVVQQNRDRENATANAYGMMTHQARNIANEHKTGYELGRTLGHMVGYTDPAEQRAQQEQAILSRYDTSTTEGMAQAAQAAKAMGRYDIVAKIQQYHTGIQKQQDAHETAQANIDKATANAEKMRRLQEARVHPGYETWKKIAQNKYPDDLIAQENYIEALYNKATKAQNIETTYKFKGGRRIKIMLNKDTGEVTEIGDEEGDKHPPFDEGVKGSNPPMVQHMVWNSVAGMYEAVGEPKPAHAGVNVSVNNVTKPANQIAQFRKNVQDTIKPSYDIVTNADLGIAALNDSLATGNFIGFNAARGSIAKAMGDNHISVADIKAAGGDPSLVGGFVDYLNKLGTGTPSIDTQKKMLATLQLLKKIASNKANAELSKQAKLGLMDNMSQDQVDAALDFPEFKSGTGSAAKTKVLKSGKTVTVEQD